MYVKIKICVKLPFLEAHKNLGRKNKRCVKIKGN